jgi:hypothetical protein
MADQMTFEQFRPYIQQKYAAVFAAGFALPSQVNPVLEVPVGEPLHKVVRFMAKIVANDFGGLLILALYGYGVSGAKVARSMFEASVNAAYLAKHPECVDDYIDFHVVAKKKFYDHLLKYDAAAAKAIGAEKIAAMELEYAQVSHRFKKHKNSWTAASIADRAEEVGSGDLYRLVYSTLSGIAHGDIVGMQTHATAEGVDVEPGPSEQWIHESLVLGHAAVAEQKIDAFRWDYNENHPHRALKGLSPNEYARRAMTTAADSLP